MPGGRSYGGGCRIRPPQGPTGSTIAPEAAALWLNSLPGQQLGPVSTNPRQRLGGGREASRGREGTSPLGGTLYKEEECEWRGLGFALPPVGLGTGHKDA